MNECDHKEIFLRDGQIKLCDADAQAFAGLLIWLEIPFTVRYETCPDGLDIIITDIRDDGK